jgi:hypothetical protein
VPQTVEGDAIQAGPANSWTPDVPDEGGAEQRPTRSP